MPGPRNAKKKKQLQSKREKARKTLDVAPERPIHRELSENSSASEFEYPSSYTQYTLNSSSPLPATEPLLSELDIVLPVSLCQAPFIQDPGNGPRVKDMHAFVSSSFASPPSLEDPLCAEFAQEEMLQMLCSILPEETAMILWYNRSRAKARVCPACQRLYRLGDVLPDHLEEEPASKPAVPSPYLFREQKISGLCSPVCFILAAFSFPDAIRSAWGRMAEEMEDETWIALDPHLRPSQNDMGLGMLVKMTRCHDLALGQLLFPDLALDSDDTSKES